MSCRSQSFRLNSSKDIKCCFGTFWTWRLILMADPYHLELIAIGGLCGRSVFFSGATPRLREAPSENDLALDWNGPATSLKSTTDSLLISENEQETNPITKLNLVFHLKKTFQCITRHVEAVEKAKVSCHHCFELIQCFGFHLQDVGFLYFGLSIDFWSLSWFLIGFSYCTFYAISLASPHRWGFLLLSSWPRRWKGSSASVRPCGSDFSFAAELK